MPLLDWLGRRQTDRRRDEESSRTDGLRCSPACHSAMEGSQILRQGSGQAWTGRHAVKEQTGNGSETPAIGRDDGATDRSDDRSVHGAPLLERAAPRTLAAPSPSSVQSRLPRSRAGVTCFRTRPDVRLVRAILRVTTARVVVSPSREQHRRPGTRCRVRAGPGCQLNRGCGDRKGRVPVHPSLVLCDLKNRYKYHSRSQAGCPCWTGWGEGRRTGDAMKSHRERTDCDVHRRATLLW